MDRVARLVMGCCICLIVLAAGGSSASAQDLSSKKPGVQLVSFNVRYQTDADKEGRNWRNRLPVLREAVRRMDPDIMGVQEALVSQLKDLQQGMPGYGMFGVGRDDGKQRGEHVSVFYKKSRFRLDSEDCGHFWLSGTPEVAASRTWGNGITRMCTWLRLIDVSSGRGVYVFNTHWDHRHQGSREQAARLIASRIDERKRRHEPVVLMGDFNVTEKNPAMRYLLGDKVALHGGNEPEQWKFPLVDGFQRLHPDQADRRTFNAWVGEKKGMAKIDHILVSTELKPIQAGIDYYEHGGIYPSDHYPVTLRVREP